MTASQFKIAATWLIGPATLYMVYGMSEQLPVHWSLVLLIGFSLCGYLRRHLPKDANNVFQIMKIKSLTIAIIYFSALAASVAWLFLKYPDILKHNPLTQMVIIILVVTPFTPNLFRHEFNLFKEVGANNA